MRFRRIVAGHALRRVRRIVKETLVVDHRPHREQIERFAARLSEKGLTLIPLRLFFTPPGTNGLKPGVVKILVGLARGKKTWDKRRTEAERDVKRELERVARR